MKLLCRSTFKFVFPAILFIIHFSANAKSFSNIKEDAKNINNETLLTIEPILTKPASTSSYSTQIPVTLTIGETYVAGSAKLIFSNASGTYSNTLTLADNISSQSFTITTANISIGSYITASTHSNLPDYTYNVTLSYQKVSLITASVTNSSVVIQTSTPSPTLTNPSNGFVFNQNAAPVFSYYLPSAPYSGTAVLTLSPGYSYNLTNNVGSNSYTITTNLPNDGTYTATVRYQDFLGNPASSSSSIGVTFDRITLSPSIVFPATNSTIAGTSTITYVTPENALSGTKRLIFSKNGTAVTTLLINDANSGTLFLNLKDLTSTSSQFSSLTGTSNIEDGTYSVTFSYQDQFGNPAASSSVNLTVKAQIFVNYVDAVNGNDLTGIGSSLLPYKTIQKAINVSSNGDSVILKNGIYQEAIDLNGKIAFLGSTYFASRDSNDIKNTILSGLTNGNTTLISNTLNCYTSYNNFHINGLTISDVRLNVINASTGNCSAVQYKVSKCVIKNSGTYGQWGVISVGTNGILDSCIIFGNKGRYIISSSDAPSPGPIITNNIIYNNTSSVDGSSFVENSTIHIERKSKIINNLIFRNFNTAIDFGGNGSDSMIFVNNTVALNSGYGIRFQTWGGVYNGVLINNISKFNLQADISSNTATNGPGIYIKNNFFGQSGSLFNTGIISSNNTILDTTGNIGGDPYFVDTLNNNFKLLPYSSAIGTGYVSTYILSKDIQGNLRINPNRTTPDIGAFESSYKFPSPFLNKIESSNKTSFLIFTQKIKNNIINYKIYRNTSSISDTSSMIEIATIDSSKKVYTDTIGLANNVKYYYRLKSVYTDNSLSGFSNQVTSIPNIVEAPQNIKIKNNPSIAKLSWDLPASRITKFQIFRSADTITKSLLADTLNANNYTDTTIVRNTKYYYWLRAIDSNGTYSNYSNMASLNPTNIWYVDSALGNNTTGIGTTLDSYKTIQKAIDVSIAGDTVLVKPGTYIESIIINKPILLQSNDSIIKAKLVQENGVGYSIKVINPSFSDPYMNTKIKGFYMKSNGVVNGSVGIRIEQKSFATIENVFMDGYEVGLSTYYGFYNVNNSIFYGQRIFAYSDAIDLNKPNIVQNSSIINTSFSVYEASTNSIHKYYNVIIANEKSKAFQSSIPFNGPKPYLFNVLLDNSFVGYNPQSGSTTYILNDAESVRFKSISGKDFVLNNYSPAIGLGNTTLNDTTDFSGNFRPNPIGSLPDLGAYENAYDHPSPFVTDSSTSNKVKFGLYQYPTNGLNKIYVFKGIATNPTIKVDSIGIVNAYTDTANKIFNKYLYYRFTSVGTGLNESGYSNEIKSILFSKPALIAPTNYSFNNDTSIKFVWSKIENALQYKLQYSQDSTFVNNVIQKSVSDTSTVVSNLKTNTNYFWRLLATDTVYSSSWSSIYKFQTFIAKPKLDSVKSIFKNLNLYWTNNDTANTKYVKIYRDSLGLANKLIDSISGNKLTYKDPKSLVLNQKYYYRIKFGNYDNIESDSSNILNATPVNTLPKAAKLSNKSYQNSGEYNFVKLSYSASASYDLDGTISAYNWYVNDSLVNKTDSVITYFFKQGTNSVKLVVIDNDGGKDSTTVIVNISSLQKQFQAGILGGISAINQNYILTADTSYNNITGSSVSLLDRSGNTILPIVVQSKIFTTPSIASDSSIFITNGSSLNGYSKSGISLWPTIPLGGISYVTPTIDSNLSRIYVGVSNKNFSAYDYKTGKNIWSVICDAPINSSAVISGDRKLIFTSQSGTLYGFDISKSDLQTTPKWRMSFGDVITKSPAVDASSNIYVGTDAGRFIKFQLNSDGSVTVKWNVTLSSSIQTSPVIDADSNLYVGTERGDLYKINHSNGSTIWTYNVGAAIHSTPNISEFGTIYVPNMNGLVTAITTNKIVLWKYQDVAAISANSLYINNMLYIASEKGTFTGIYDNPNSVNINTSFANSGHSYSNNYGSLAAMNNIKFPAIFEYYSNYYKATSIDILSTTVPITQRQPVWGTFQGDYRRTGSLSLTCPTSLTITKDSTGTLYANNPYIQWYKDGNAIVNENNISYKPASVGSYSVKNNQLGCSVLTSNSYYYLITDVININNEEYVKVNPNPISNLVNFDFLVKGYQHLDLDIFSLSSGSKIASKQNIYSGEQISFGTLSAGIYLFKLTTPDGKLSYQFKMVKL